MPIRYSDLFERLGRRMAMWFYNFNDVVCLPYEKIRAELINSGLNCRYEITPLGVDIKRFNPSKNKHDSKQKIGIESHKKVIGYCGRISKEKNVITLFEAFKKLSDQENLVLLIVGDGDENMMEEMQKLQNCICTGFVNDVQRYLQAMDVFVMPSLTETTSLATLEAMACGLPVISSKVGMIADYLKKGVNGEFFPRENPVLLALKIERLLREPLYAGGLGHNARRKVVYAFSWERSINKIIKVIRKIHSE